MGVVFFLLAVAARFTVELRVYRVIFVAWKLNHHNLFGGLSLLRLSMQPLIF